MEVFSIVILLVFIPLCIFMAFARGGMHEGKIRSEIESLGGEVISIERRNIFTGLGPFMVVGKGRVVYRIKYKIQGVEKEGWVRFGGMMGPDWRL